MRMVRQAARYMLPGDLLALPCRMGILELCVRDGNLARAGAAFVRYGARTLDNMLAGRMPTLPVPNPEP